MIKIFETSKIKELDQYTVDHEPIASVDLVERAATAFVNEFGRLYSKQSRVIVFAGQGNNGADALAIARLLAEDDYRIEVYLFNPGRHLSPDCEANKQRLLADGKILLNEVIEDFTPPILSEHDVVIDGLFGSGLNRPLSGGYAAVVDYINQSDATVVSIDIPSGLFGEDNRENDPDSIIQADMTFTFEFPKLSMVLPENAAYVGRWKVLPIGLHPDIMARTKTPYMLIKDEDMTGILRTRNVFAHKGDFGHALLISGSKGKMGAALLAAGACMRSGVGRLTVHLPQRGETVLQTALPEAMLSLDADADRVSVLPDTDGYDAIAAGPGLGTEKQTVQMLEQLLKTFRKPLLLDADALNILAQHKEFFSRWPPRTVLTPHPKELDRRLGDSVNGYERLHKAAEMAMKHTQCIVLKGAYTAVCTPQGNIYINTTGNPGMATAGSGDVLTGVIVGLMAQGYEPETAAVVGVFLHGMAGDLAVARLSDESLIASDIIRMLGKAFRLQHEEE